MHSKCHSFTSQSSKLGVVNLNSVFHTLMRLTPFYFRSGVKEITTIVEKCRAVKIVNFYIKSTENDS